MNPSPNLFVIGPSGAGKTSVGRRLAAHYGMALLDLDHEIERHTGVDIPTIFDIEGEAGFRQREATLLDALSQRDGIVLVTGAGAILDTDNRRHISERGFVLWLDAGIDQQLARLAHDRQRPLLATADRRGRLDDMARVRTPLYTSLADLHIEAREETIARVVQRTLRALESAWTRTSAGVPSS